MDPITGSLLLASAGSAAYSAFGPKPKMDYGYLDNIYARRMSQISDFQSQLNGARSRYLASLGNMYSQSYGRFSQNAEAGFANRGLSVSGGAFASALAKKTADYQAELEPMAYNAEREDLTRVDNAYGNAASLYGQGMQGRAGAEFDAGRGDSQALGRFVGSLASYGLAGGFSSGGGAKTTQAGTNQFWGGEYAPRSYNAPQAGYGGRLGLARNYGATPWG